LCSNEDIIELDITDNAIGPQGAKYIAQALKLNETLEILNLSENRIQSFGIKLICASLLVNSTLTTLNLSGNGLRDRDAPFIATVLRKNSSIVDLDLSHNEFGDKSGSFFGQTLWKNKTLRRIDLSWNQFKDPGSFFLLGGIRKNMRGLESVNLAFNGLSTPDMTMLFEILKRHRTLKELDISGNQLIPDHGVVIAAAMETNNRLETLRLGLNAIGSTSAFAILRAVLRPACNVKILDMEKIDVYKNFVKELEKSKKVIEVNYGHVMGEFTMTNIYQRRRDFAKEVVAAFNTAHFRPVRIYLFKAQMLFIDFLKAFDKSRSYQANAPEMKTALENPVYFEFEADELQQCKASLEQLANRSTELGFSSIKNITFDFSGFFVV